MLPLAAILGWLTSPPLAAEPKVVERAVTFQAGDVELAGTLALPPDAPPRVPALLLVPGGAYEDADRDAKFFGISFYKQIAHSLAARGVASLRYDKRGVGKSKGERGSVTIQSLAADVRAALVFLRAVPEIDPRRLGALGHGEGVNILIEAVHGDRSLVAAVLIGASSARGEDAIIENWKGMVESRPNTTGHDAAMAQQRRVIEAVRTGASLNQFSPAVSKYAQHPYFKSLILYDPKPKLARLRAPVLIVHGQMDRQVSADHAIIIEGVLKKGGNRRVTVQLDPNLNHLLAASHTGSVYEYGSLGTSSDAKALERLSEWAGKTLKATPRKPDSPAPPPAR